MRTTDDRPNKFPLPPIFLVVSIILALLLDSFYPLPFAIGAARDILQGAGFFAIIAAVGLYYFAIRELNRRKTTVLPHKAASSLVTTGPFAVSRNPIYLANFVLLAGLGLLITNLWMVVAALLSAILEHVFAIKREEAHLEHKFGRAWRDYKRRVRRWI
jgi:protein-S-isoprenylcysteine O-methyltransferase Ste14